MIAAVALLRRVLTGAWILVLVGLIGLAAFTRLNTTFVILGASMEPAIPFGSLVSLETVPATSIKQGDVVTIRADNGTVITHRVVRAVELRDGLFFETKGDANATPDPALVPARSVVGRVAGDLPSIGFLTAMLGTTWGLISILSLLAAGLVAIWLLEEVEAELVEERVLIKKRARKLRGAARAERSSDGTVA